MGIKSTRKITRFLAETPPIVGALLAIALVLLAMAFSSLQWFGLDWRQFYQPGALNATPYELRKVVAPPWTYWTLWPVAVLGDNLSLGVLALATMLICMLYMRDWPKFAVLCLSIPFQATLVLGQVDALSLIGLMAPAGLSLLFLTMKPQGAILAMLNKRATGASLLAIACVFVVSLAAHGWWPAVLLEPMGWDSNWSLWPWSLPVGLALLWWQGKRGFDSDAALCLASLCVAPYFCVTSLLPVTAAAIKELDLPCAAAFAVLPWALVVAMGVVP